MPRSGTRSHRLRCPITFRSAAACCAKAAAAGQPVGRRRQSGAELRHAPCWPPDYDYLEGCHNWLYLLDASDRPTDAIKLPDGSDSLRTCDCCRPSKWSFAISAALSGGSSKCTSRPTPHSGSQTCAGGVAASVRPPLSHPPQSVLALRRSAIRRCPNAYFAGDGGGYTRPCAACAGDQLRAAPARQN